MQRARFELHSNFRIAFSKKTKNVQFIESGEIQPCARSANNSRTRIVIKFD